MERGEEIDFILDSGLAVTRGTDGSFLIDEGGIHRISSDRFIADWQSSDSQRQALSRSGDHNASGKVREAMAGMAKGLERDPQLESLLRNRTQELGLSSQSGQSLSQDLQRHLGRSLGRGLGL